MVNSRLFGWVKCQARMYAEIAKMGLQRLRVSGLEGTFKSTGARSCPRRKPPLGTALRRPLKTWGGSHCSPLFARGVGEAFFCFRKNGITLCTLLHTLLFSRTIFLGQRPTFFEQFLYTRHLHQAHRAGTIIIPASPKGRLMVRESWNTVCRIRI